MSAWFKNRRQEFIAATLRQFGQVRRQDIMREFDVSLPQASADIQAFLAASPAHARYDVSAKAYVLVEEPVLERQRCGCKPEVYERVQRGGTCGMGGCPYGGDF